MTVRRAVHRSRGATFTAELRDHVMTVWRDGRLVGESDWDPADVDDPVTGVWSLFTLDELGGAEAPDDHDPVYEASCAVYDALIAQFRFHKHEHSVVSAAADVSAAVRGSGDPVDRSIVEWLDWRVECAWNDPIGDAWMRTFDEHVRETARAAVRGWRALNSEDR